MIVAMKHLEKRDLFGIPPRETPAGIFPQSSAPALSAPRAEAARVEARKPPVAVGTLASGTTVVRPIRFEGHEKEQS